MKSLYRRYRPTKLAEVVGQPQVTEPLLKSLAQGKISHAYLFIGPRGCGKTSVARIMAHEVNGFEYEIEDDYVDIIEIDGASNRGIDNIRELREKVAIAPSSGKYKVYIIDEVHMLTKEAFNALLKTLEEPPAHAIFIMATTDAYKVPVTITSRAQTYTFNLVSSDVMVKHLKSICDKEGIKIADDALSIIAKRGGGSFRDSLSLLDQISSLSDSEITKEMVISAMGLPQDEKIAELIAAYTVKDFTTITTLLKDLMASGIKAETLAEEMIHYIIEKPQPELLNLLAKLPDVKAPYAEAKLIVALLNNSATTVNPNTSTTWPAQTPQRNALQAPQAMTTQKPQNTKTAPDSAISHAKSSDGTKAPAAANELNDPAPAVFDWHEFTTRVQELNDAVFSQLVKTKYEVEGGTLHIYPGKKIVKTILSRDNNKRILTDAAGGRVKITIHDENDTPSGAQKDEFLDKMSDIMGGEVINDGGGSPF